MLKSVYMLYLLHTVLRLRNESKSQENRVETRRCFALYCFLVCFEVIEILRKTQNQA